MKKVRTKVKAYVVSYWKDIGDGMFLEEKSITSSKKKVNELRKKCKDELLNNLNWEKIPTSFDYIVYGIDHIDKNGNISYYEIFEKGEKHSVSSIHNIKTKSSTGKIYSIPRKSKE